MTDRLHATEAALDLVAKLRAAHGPLLFVLSHGCCDGATPMCLTVGELQPGPSDIRFGEVGGAPFYVDARQLAAQSDLAFTLDVAPANNGAFSLEDGSGQRFVLLRDATAAP